MRLLFNILRCLLQSQTRVEYAELLQEAAIVLDDGREEEEERLGEGRSRHYRVLLPAGAAAGEGVIQLGHPLVWVY